MRAVIVFLAFISLPGFSMNLAESEVKRIGSWIQGVKVAGDAKFRQRIRDLVFRNDYEDLDDFFKGVDQKIDLKAALNYQDFENLPILHQALLAPNTTYEIYEKLLQYGANPNLALVCNFRKGKKGYLFYAGYTAAHVAVRMRKSQKIFELLYEYEADYFQKDGGGWSPYKLAHDSKIRSALTFFVKFSVKEPPLIIEERSDDDVSEEQTSFIVHSDSEGSGIEDCDTDRIDGVDEISLSTTEFTDANHARGSQSLIKVSAKKLEKEKNNKDRTEIAGDLILFSTTKHKQGEFELSDGRDNRENGDERFGRYRVKKHRGTESHTHLPETELSTTELPKKIVNNVNSEEVIKFLEQYRKNEYDAEWYLSTCGFVGTLAVFALGWGCYYGINYAMGTL